jgi:serine/threonine protein kinase
VFQKELGEGSYAHVFAAVDAADQNKVQSAVKVFNLFPGSLKHVMKSDVVSELIPLNMVFPLINTPCSVAFTDPGIRSDQDPPRKFIVQMNMAHCDLLDLIYKTRLEDAALRNQGIERPYTTFSPEEMNLLAYEVVLAVAYTHSRLIVHCDIKTQNLLVYSVPGTEFSKAVLNGDDTVKLIALSDFGISEYNVIYPREYDGEVITVNYRPPEMLLHKSVVTYSSDVWSVGCVLYEMATGHRLLDLKKDEPIEALERLIQIFGADAMQRVYTKDVESEQVPQPQQPPRARFSRLPLQRAPMESKKRRRMFTNISEEDETRLFFAGPSFPGEIEKTFTEPLRAYPGLERLIMSMLRLDPNERLSIFDVLSSSYFTNNTKHVCDATILRGARIPHVLHFTRTGAVIFSVAAEVLHGKEAALWNGQQPLSSAPNVMGVDIGHSAIARQLQLMLNFTRSSFTKRENRQIIAIAINLLWQLERKNNFIYNFTRNNVAAMCGLAELIVNNNTADVPLATVFNQAELLTTLDFNIHAATLNDFFELYLLSLNYKRMDDQMAAIAWELTYIFAMSVTMPRKYMPSEIAAIAICIVYSLPEIDTRWARFPLQVANFLGDAMAAFAEFTPDQLSYMSYIPTSLGYGVEKHQRLIAFRNIIYGKLSNKGVLLI